MDHHTGLYMYDIQLLTGRYICKEIQQYDVAGVIENWTLLGPILLRYIN